MSIPRRLLSPLATLAMLALLAASAFGAKPEKFGQGMLSGLTRTSGGSGNVSFSAGVDFTQYSGTGIRTAVVDCKTGRVMWSDGDHEDKSLNDDRARSHADAPRFPHRTRAIRPRSVRSPTHTW